MTPRVKGIQCKDIFNVLYLRTPLSTLQYTLPICIAASSKLYFKKGLRNYAEVCNGKATSSLPMSFRAHSPPPLFPSRLPSSVSFASHKLGYPVDQEVTMSVFLAPATGLFKPHISHYLKQIIKFAWELLKLQIPCPYPRPSIQTKEGNVPRLSLKKWLLKVLLPLPSLPA